MNKTEDNQSIERIIRKVRTCNGIAFMVGGAVGFGDSSNNTGFIIEERLPLLSLAMMPGYFIGLNIAINDKNGRIEDILLYTSGVGVGNYFMATLGYSIGYLTGHVKQALNL